MCTTEGPIKTIKKQSFVHWDSMPLQNLHTLAQSFNNNVTSEWWYKFQRLDKSVAIQEKQEMIILTVLIKIQWLALW